MPPSDGAPLLLLLVEDDADFGFLMSKSLERAGHHVTVCATAEAALGVLRERRFDLISTGQGLPGMLGLQFLDTLNGLGITTPTIMVAGFPDPDLPAQALRAGALDFVEKDRRLTFLAELPERVRTALSKSAHLNEGCSPLPGQLSADAKK